MTDAAIVADSGAAPADVGGAPINENPAGFTQPLGSPIPPDAQADAQPAKPVSLDDSIDRAIAKSAEKEAAKAAPEKAAKEPAKEQQPRENGKFVAAEKVSQGEPVRIEGEKARPVQTEQPKPALPSHTAGEPPARFSPDAKTEWATAPESVRRETERAIRELTEGHQKYKADAETFNEVREYHEMATKSGTTLKAALAEYTGIENLLKADVVGGLERIVANLGLKAPDGRTATLRDVAAAVLNQSPDVQASRQTAIINELRSELAQIKQQVGSVTQTLTQQKHDTVLSEVEKFASQPEHSRFDELFEDIHLLLLPVHDKDGKVVAPARAKDLSEAYAMAERLNPAPVNGSASIQAASSAAPAPEVQPSKGQKSINGAPSSASSATGKKRAAKSLDDALDAAFAHTG